LKKNNKKTFIFPDILRHKMVSINNIKNYKIIQNNYNHFIIELDNEVKWLDSVKEELISYFKNFSDEELIIEFKKYKENKIENKLRRIEKRFNDE
jgi:hypothetical protein